MDVAGELSGEDAAGKESLPSEPHIVGYCPEKQNAYILGINGRRHFAASLALGQEQLLVDWIDHYCDHYTIFYQVFEVLMDD